MVGEEVGIVLTDGISRVVLTPVGPPALGYPTRMAHSPLASKQRRGTIRDS
jgi:hypothetical protein